MCFRQTINSNIASHGNPGREEDAAYEESESGRLSQ